MSTFTKQQWENNTEGLLNTYNSYAESIKGTAPKVAKALYESMANACRSQVILIY